MIRTISFLTTALMLFGVHPLSAQDRTLDIKFATEITLQGETIFRFDALGEGLLTITARGSDKFPVSSILLRDEFTQVRAGLFNREQVVPGLLDYEKNSPLIYHQLEDNVIVGFLPVPQSGSYTVSVHSWNLLGQTSSTTAGGGSISFQWFPTQNTVIPDPDGDSSPTTAQILYLNSPTTGSIGGKGDYIDWWKIGGINPDNPNPVIEVTIWNTEGKMAWIAHYLQGEPEHAWPSDFKQLQIAVVEGAPLLIQILPDFYGAEAQHEYSYTIEAKIK